MAHFDDCSVGDTMIPCRVNVCFSVSHMHTHTDFDCLNYGPKNYFPATYLQALVWSSKPLQYL